MNAAERRHELKQALLKAQAPLSATSLAAKFGVSRQVIVGDVALLRAEGCPVVATPRGYLCQSQPQNRCTIACRHTNEQLLDELYTIVDTGCSVQDVIVEHAVYGQLAGNLSVASRYDADLFLEKLQANQALPLSRLTEGVHLHTLSYPTQDALMRCKDALRKKGYLLEV